MLVVVVVVDVDWQLAVVLHYLLPAVAVEIEMRKRTMVGGRYLGTTTCLSTTTDCECNDD